MSDATGGRRQTAGDWPAGARSSVAFWLAALTVLGLARQAVAEDAPAATAAPAQPPALRFARHDVARWSAAVKPLADAASQAGAALEAATRALAEAKATQAAAEKTVADAPAAIAAADEAKAAAARAVAGALETLNRVEAEKKGDQAALAAAAQAVDAAVAGFENAGKQRALAVEGRKQAEAAKADADRKIPELEPALKAATEAKAAADKALAEIAPQLARAQERLTAFEKAAPAPDPAATRLVQTITHDRPLLACRFDPRGDFLYAGGQDNQFHRWDLFTGSAVHVAAHKSWLGALALLPPDGATVLTGGHEGQLAWWNGQDPAPAAGRRVPAHQGYVRAVTVSPDGQLIATCGNDNLVRVWSAADGALVKELAGHERHVYHVAFHPSGKALVSGDLLGVIRQWDVGPWTQTRELDAKVLSKYDPQFKADVGGVRTFAFSPDGSRLAAGGITDVSNAFAGIGVPCVVQFDWESGKQIKVQKPKDAFQGSVFGVRYSPAGDFLVGVGGAGGGGMWFWKPDEEASFHFVKLPTVAYDLDLHPDGLRLAVAQYDKALRIYDMAPKFEAAPEPAPPAAK